MDIKKANVNLLLGKIKELLGSLPEEAKKGEKFLEAEKALAKMLEIFKDKDGEVELIVCRKKQPAM
jgi:hypothetical protein